MARYGHVMYEAGGKDVPKNAPCGTLIPLENWSLWIHAESLDASLPLGHAVSRNLCTSQERQNNETRVKSDPKH